MPAEAQAIRLHEVATDEPPQTPSAEAAAANRSATGAQSTASIATKPARPSAALVAGVEPGDRRGERRARGAATSVPAPRLAAAPASGR